MQRNQKYSTLIVAFSAFVLCNLCLFGVGCSTYTLSNITAVEAHSDFSVGATYRVASSNAYLVRSSTKAIGFGQPNLELSRWEPPDRSSVHDLPAGTPVKIERYVRFDQHGLYDCGFDGWRFAIASVPEGKLRGTRFLINLEDLIALKNPE